MGKYLRTFLKSSSIEDSFKHGEVLLAAVLASRWLPERARDLPQLEAQSDLTGWEAALKWHGVAGILKKYHSEALKQLSPRFRAVLDTLHFQLFNESLQQFALTKAILDSLQQAGITAVPLKGSVLSAQLYGDIGARSSSDIDILIDPDDFERTYRVMLELNYQPELDLYSDSRTLKYVLMLHKDVSFLRPENPVVEIHFRNEPAPETSLPRLKNINQLENFRFQGLDCSVLGPDELRHSVVQHALRSNVNRWKWGYDVLQLVSAREEYNPWSNSGNILLSRAEQVCLYVLAREWNLPRQNFSSHRISGQLVLSASEARRRYFTATRWHQYIPALVAVRLLHSASRAVVYDRWQDRLFQIGNTMKMGWHPSHGAWQAAVLTRLPLAGIAFGIVRNFYGFAGALIRKATKGTNHTSLS
ncbi:MAG TPA: hypothetical protein DIW43_12560 [Spongiibacteraceae bacterium]|nr:hypothetical protein [Spongiibacteraceae bacterium]HCS28282.1 hypothetical protein [Spongiibacteraceae bacterium]